VAREHRYRSAATAVAAVLLTLALVGAPAALAAPPNAEFSHAPSTARVNGAVSFSAEASGNGGASVASLSWDFGDGSSGSGATPQHAYGSPGDRSVTLTVVDSNAEQRSVTHAVHVVGDPVARFSVSPAVPEIGAAVSFNASDAGDPGGAIASYQWDFGDGSTGSGASPQHAYRSGGDKTVRLTVTAALDGRTDSVTHTVHVNLPPDAALTIASVIGSPPTGGGPFTPLIGQQVAFSAQASSDADGSIASYAWDLGGGTFGAPATVSYLFTTFPRAGRRTVRVRITDDRGATGTAQLTFRVNTPPVAGFGFAPATPEPNAVVRFTSSAADADGDPLTTGWDLDGNGSYDDATGPTARAVFMAPGDYRVGMRVTDSGGASATESHTVAVRGAAVPTATPPPGSGPPGSGQPIVIVPAPGSGAAPSSSGTGASAAAGLGAAAATPPFAGLKALTGVRLQVTGTVAAGLTRISRLTLLAPAGALVVARCHGRGCPRRGVRHRVATSGRLRLRALERGLRAGARIVVSVAKDGFVTQQIVLTIRRGSAPRRTQGCVVPGTRRTGPCPAS
jgi:PKD repeat protein